MPENDKPKKSLRGQINLSFLLIVAIAVVSFMLVSINRSSSALKENSIKYTSQLVQIVNENIDSYIENMENISQIVTSNSDVRNYLSQEENKEQYAPRVEELFSTFKEARKDIYNIGVLGNDGSYLINTRNVEINPHVFWRSLDWYRRTLNEKETLSSSHVQNLVHGEYPWVVTISKIIIDPVEGKEIGVLFVDLNYHSISDLAENVDLGQKSYIYIMDDNGDIVYHPKQQLIYSGIWHEESEGILGSTKETGNWELNGKLYSITSSKMTGWTVVGVTDMNEMLTETRSVVNLYYIIAMCLIGVAMLLAVLLSGRITRPLRKLQGSMQSVKDGNFDVQISEDSSQDEIGDLTSSFKRMINEIEQLIDRNTKEQEEKRKYELNALQAQIQPHFLYNTLDSIIWMAEGNETKDVVLMTSALAKLFRKSISNSDEMVTVNEEMEYTRSYLTIQKMRYRGELQYSIDVAPAIADVEIIKLIVQPLVENAIYHGTKYKTGIGTIKITVDYEDKGIVIRIVDDGVGMTKEQLAHIFDEDKGQGKNSKFDERRSVGVLNVHQRIQLHYGEEYGLSFESKEGVGTTVSIYLPDQTGEGYEK